MSNLDPATVEGFGQEWSHYPQNRLSPDEQREVFEQYFAIFPWAELPPGSSGFDAGCGSGRWALLVSGRVGHLHCVDASPKALKIARINLAGSPGCEFHLASIDRMPFLDDSMDFGYALGVLHHVPDTAAGLKSCVAKLKPGAPFLVYLYYDFENRPAWFRLLWKLSEGPRWFISMLPFAIKYPLCLCLAAVVYWPLARLAYITERVGFDVAHFPLSYYRERSFYIMRTDALDRFGTRLERRFSSAEIREMMEAAGLEAIVFSPRMPHWCAVGRKRGSS